VQLIDFFGYHYGWTKKDVEQLTPDEINRLYGIIRKRETKGARNK
tara:strand:- start:294 stop:428 length:135 start_codon:yes stop_codon:yes gene_type:complete